jgi:hypothetical protein
MKSQKATSMEMITEILSTSLEEYDHSNKDTHPFITASAEDKNNEELVFSHVQKHGFILEFASKELQDNKKIVLEAVSRCSGAYHCFDNALKFASKRLQDDKEVVLRAVIADPISLEYASERLKDDKEVVLKAILMKEMREHGCFYMDYSPALEFASKRLQDDEEVVSTAIKIEPHSLEYASKRLQNNSDIVLPAIEKDAYTLKYASLKFRDDKELVLKTIAKDPSLFGYISKRLQEDKEVLLKAINNVDHPLYSFLKYTSSKLRDDKEVVLQIISKIPSELQYASSMLQDDEEVVDCAIKINTKVFQFASKRLQQDKRMIIILDQAKKDEYERNMSYWYGWGIFDTETNTLVTEKILSVPHDTYDEAKNDRDELKAPDIKTTDIFKANSRAEAEEKMLLAEFKFFQNL